MRRCSVILLILFFSCSKFHEDFELLDITEIETELPVINIDDPNLVRAEEKITWIDDIVNWIEEKVESLLGYDK